ncbi:ferredoxin--NADP reductase [Zavarzinia compransoris]|uniref:ferredoxin--NADP reductase n=1 Tax=Rhodospirillales TaxID=204441 RepID=UPI001F48D832|nr:MULTISPECIES: ferredoxin--NADP reductase [Rhodospirillales]MCF4164659.1 ferredoxin--NADP reductase [Zavarzinia marina]MCW0232734.1 ferredoxin--NADP reductase [Ferrovibrio sp.]
MKRIVKETDEAVSVVLAPVDGIPKDLRAGQFLTLIAQIDGQAVKRAYSLSELPNEGTMTITSKRVEGGVMSTYLNTRLREGAWLQFAGPSGDFVLPARVPTHYVFAAAGSGITPIMAMVEQLLEHENNHVPIAVFYGNRREQDILFRERLDAWANRHENLTIHYVLSQPAQDWNGRRGRISAEELRGAAPGTGAIYFLCGPDDFNESLRRQLIALAIPAQAIASEQFTTLARESRPHPKDSHIVVFRVGGSEREVTVRPTETLLEAGLRAGIALPFSCTMGGCGHCKVKILDGDVATDAPNCLTEPELQAGYALACCAYPHHRATVAIEEKVS